jgi:phosphotransferase system enzyme I (PtsI)
MIRCSGKSVLKGIAIGKIHIYRKMKYTPIKTQVECTKKEIERFQKAVKEAKEQLKVLYRDALESVGEDQAMIFDVHKMMLEDEGFLEDISIMIKENCNAEYAVHEIGNNYSQMFSSMDNEYMKARSVDVLDISRRVIHILVGAGNASIKWEEPVILLVDDLTPSETIQMDKDKILAFVTLNGSISSHTSILARSMHLPSLVNTNVALLEEYHGKMAIVDAFLGELIIDPSEDVLQEMITKKNEWISETENLKKLIGQDNITTDGRRVNVYCNIGNTLDVDRVLQSDADGIGLFRSEFLYLGRNTFPTEEEQFQSYKTVVEKMNGKKVIIRTFDIGADKKADYFKLDHEENPAMGYRAIRICLDREDIFRTQLRAIYRASAYGTVSIMFPMIISVDEVRKIKDIVQSIKKELLSKNIRIGDVELGIMIETPAAALISDELAKEVEFFSIGTNDLTQYTLAVDRQNQKLGNIYDSHHKAVLKLIHMTVENGHKENIWVGICGELAGDSSLTRTFVDMGVDELSVSPPFVLGLRKTIRDI